MKKTTAFAVALAAAFAFGGESADAEKEAKKLEAKERMLQKTGGIIEKAGEGRVVVVNAQEKIPESAIAGRIAAAAKLVRVKFDLENRAGADGFSVADARLPENAQAAIFVVEDAKLPLSLVAVEAGWGMVNVAQLSEGKRFNVEFNRVLTLALGGGISQFKASPMQTVKSADDLDGIVGENLTFDAVTSILRNLQNLGVTQTKKSTYTRACEEGWAPEPADEHQKAIWEKVKAEQNEKPSNPITIEFDPEKGE